MRDIKKQAQQGREIIRKHNRADLSISELNKLYDDFTAAAEQKGVHEALWDTIGDCFYMGVAVGRRNA